MGAVVSFAQDAKVVTFGGAGPAWPSYVPLTASSARMGEGDHGDVLVGTIPKIQQLAIWDGILGY